MPSSPSPSPYTDFKESVRAASTGDITLNDLPEEIDGVSMSYGDRFLAKDQDDPVENGIYIYLGEDESAEVTTGGRDGQLTSGGLIVVEEGDTHADTLWMLTTDDPIEVGETELEFAEVSGGSGGVQLSDNNTWTGVNIFSNSVTLASGHAGDLSMGSNKISFLADPDDPQDAATKQYVDDNAGGLDPDANETINGIWDFTNGANFGGSNFYAFQDTGSWVFISGRLTFEAHSQFGDLAFNNGTQYRQLYRGTGGHTFTLQIAGSGQRSHLIENQGTGNLTVDCDPSDQISLWGINYPSVTLAPGEALEAHSSPSGSFWHVYKHEAAGGGGGVGLGDENFWTGENTFTQLTAVNGGLEVDGDEGGYIYVYDGGDVFVQTTSAGSQAFAGQVVGDSNDRFKITGGGTILIGDGTTSPDCTIGSDGAGGLEITTATGNLTFFPAGDTVFNQTATFNEPVDMNGNVSLGDGPTRNISFFGAPAVPQQPTPVTLGDVIALLQAYGLAA